MWNVDRSVYYLYNNKIYGINTMVWPFHNIVPCTTYWSVSMRPVECLVAPPVIISRFTPVFMTIFTLSYHMATLISTNIWRVYYQDHEVGIADRYQLFADAEVVLLPFKLFYYFSDDCLRTCFYLDLISSRILFCTFFWNWLIVDFKILIYIERMSY